MRVFLASDKVADYQPRKPNQIQQAKDATELVNFIFLEEVGGYKILADAIDDALTLGNGIIKHWWDTTPCYEVSTHTGLTEDEFTQLVADDDVEVLEHTKHAAEPVQADVPVPVDPAAAAQGMGLQPSDAAMGGPVQPGPGAGPAAPAPGAMPVAVPQPTHDVKIKHKKDEGHLRVQAMPPENFLIARNAIVLDETVDLVGHWDTPTRSDLIKRWPDKKEEINALPAWSEGMDSATKSSRDADLRALLSNATTTDKSMERVKIYEVYPLVDYDGDGIAERRYIVTGDRGRTDKEGRVLLENVEWPDDLPFTDLVADPVPHQWVGRSIFDEMSDIQRIKTVLTRQTLDNLYLANQPQRAANLSQVENPDELINPTIGGVVLTKGEPAGVIMDLAVPFVAQHSYAALEYFDSVGTRRVGNITMGLDPETLQNQTATSVQAQQSAGQSKVELFARNIAETGLKRLFKCLLKLLITHQTEPKFMRRKGEPIAMEPSGWDSDMDVSINVGLGAGTRDHDMMLLQQIAMKQEIIFQSMGPDNPLVSLMEYRNTLAKMVEVGGVRSPELYFKEVDPQTLQAFVQQMQNQARSEGDGIADEGATGDAKAPDVLAGREPEDAAAGSDRTGPGSGRHCHQPDQDAGRDGSR
jgi:hypothetical protein